MPFNNLKTRLMQASQEMDKLQEKEIVSCAVLEINETRIEGNNF